MDFRNWSVYLLDHMSHPDVLAESHVVKFFWSLWTTLLKSTARQTFHNKLVQWNLYLSNWIRSSTKRLITGVYTFYSETSESTTLQDKHITTNCHNKILPTSPIQHPLITTTYTPELDNGPLTLDEVVHGKIADLDTFWSEKFVIVGQIVGIDHARSPDLSQ